ncbi:MAG TPA: hypothetical protein PLC35_10585 [Methanosarcina vacuolata]|nr:hypothetical protein [Methanosarcina vacuolata]
MILKIKEPNQNLRIENLRIENLRIENLCIENLCRVYSMITHKEGV